MDASGESAPNDYLIEAYGIPAGHVAKAAREMIGVDVEPTDRLVLIS